MQVKESIQDGHIISNNRSISHNFHVEETYSAGIILLGWEVKPILFGKISLQESYVSVSKNNEIYLIKMHITPMTEVECNPIRNRKLLLNKKEINKLLTKSSIRGYTIVPINLHFHNGKIKLQIGLAKGKKLFDKRESDKCADGKREIDRMMKNVH
jgi:SsrA-binding protein